MRVQTHGVLGGEVGSGSGPSTHITNGRPALTQRLRQAGPAVGGMFVPTLPSTKGTPQHLLTGSYYSIYECQVDRSQVEDPSD